MAKIGEWVFPGDILKDVKTNRNVTITGPGLQRTEDEANQLLITRTGILSFKTPNVYWVDAEEGRYVPRKGDLVIGIVAKRAGDTVRVDIGSSELAVLSAFAFEGATKKTKPDLNIGDAIYGKLITAYKEMEPELVCVDSYYKAGKLGLLSNNGFIFNISNSLLKYLLNPGNPLLRALGKKFPFEIVIGMNGKVWINTNNVNAAFSLIKALKAAENMDGTSIVDLCRKYR